MASATGWKEIDKVITETERLIEESGELWKAVERTNKFQPKNPFKRTKRKRRLIGYFTRTK